MKNFCKVLIIPLAACGLLATGAASAEQDSGFYLGASYTQLNTDILDDDPGVLNGIIGWSANENFGVEARIGGGVKDGSLLGFDVSVDSYYGVFLRGTLPVTDLFSIYAVAGYGSGELSVFGVSDSASSAAYGAGFELSFGDRRANSLGLEWAQYFEDADGISLSYRYKF